MTDPNPPSDPSQPSGDASPDGDSAALGETAPSAGTADAGATDAGGSEDQTSASTTSSGAASSAEPPAGAPTQPQAEVTAALPVAPISEPEVPGPDDRPSSTRQPLVIGLSIALVIAIVAALAGWIQYSREVEHTDELEAQVDDLEGDVAELEARIDDLESSGSGVSGLLDDLFGGGELPELDELGDLFGGLLNGGDLEDLGDLGGILGRLFGSEDLEGLGSLFGDGDLSALGDLFGGLFDDGSGADQLYGIGGPAAILECTDLAGLGSASIPDDDARAQYDATVEWIERERGHRFDVVPEPTYLSFDEIDERIREDFEDSYSAEDAALDAHLYSALGAIEPDSDLTELLSDFVGEGQVAGFYDPETAELVVGTEDPDEPLDATGLITLAHELDHALTDQALGLPDTAEIAERDGDGAAAASSLVEGDATLLMNNFSLSALDPADLLGSVDLGALSSQQAGLDAAPHVFARQLLFPYTQGLELTCAIYADGGWAGLDDAYDDLPATTAQVLWPERYFDDENALDAPDITAPGQGWSLARATTLGAADLMFLFEAPGDDRSAALDDPVERASAWAGDEVYQYERDGERALGISFVARAGDESLCDSIVELYDAAFPSADLDGDGERFEGDDGAQAAAVRCEGDNVKLGIAPDRATATALVR